LNENVFSESTVEYESKLRQRNTTLLNVWLFLNAFGKVQGTTLGEEGGGGGQRIENNSTIQPQEEEKSILTDREKEASL